MKRAESAAYSDFSTQSFPGPDNGLIKKQIPLSKNR